MDTINAEGDNSIGSAIGYIRGELSRITFIMLTTFKIGIGGVSNKKKHYYCIVPKPAIDKGLVMAWIR